MRERGCVRVAQMSMALHLIPRESFWGLSDGKVSASPPAPPQCSINSPLTFRHSVAEIQPAMRVGDRNAAARRVFFLPEVDEAIEARGISGEVEMLPDKTLDEVGMVRADG